MLLRYQQGGQMIQLRTMKLQTIGKSLDFQDAPCATAPSLPQCQPLGGLRIGSASVCELPTVVGRIVTVPRRRCLLCFHELCAEMEYSSVYGAKSWTQSARCGSKNTWDLITLYVTDTLWYRITKERRRAPISCNVKPGFKFDHKRITCDIWAPKINWHNVFIIVVINKLVKKFRCPTSIGYFSNSQMRFAKPWISCPSNRVHYLRDQDHSWDGLCGDE